MRFSTAFVVLGLSAAFFLTTTRAQQTPGVMNLTAKAANIAESGKPLSISILRWSTDAERNAVVNALNPTAPPPAAEGNRGGRGGAVNPPAPEPTVEAAPDPDAVPQAGRGGRGGGRGGRGGGNGGRAGGGDAAAPPPPPPPTPAENFAAALGKAPTVGYIWTNEVVGYAIKYAHRSALPDGGERIILASDRRLGAYTSAWKAAGASTPTDYKFTLIELRLDTKGVGEGKTSLTTKVVLENGAKDVGLENYASAPAMLQNVKR